MSRIVSYFRTLCRLAVAGFAAVVLVMAAFYLYLQPGLPSVEQLRDIRLQTPLRVYSSDNQLIAEFGEMRRTPLKLEDVPDRQIQAFLAAEDSRFHSHNGVDVRGLARAAVELASTGRIQSGGSTITMQVAKNFFLTRDRTFLRKFNEILLALQIEREITKDEILELYLNKIYLGNRAYGLTSAANVYYGKGPDELDLAQMAMVAGLPKAPSAYNPLANPSRAVARRDWILGRMLELDYITVDDYEEAIAAPVTARYHGPEVELEAPYVAEMARADVFRRVGQAAYTDGYRVEVTVNSKRQKAANQALREGLEAYDRRHGYRGPIDEWSLNEDADTESLQARLAGINRIADLLPAVIVAVEDDHAIAVTRPYGQVRIPMANMVWARPYRNENSQGPAPETPADVVAEGHVVRVRIPVQPVVEGIDSAPIMEAQLSQVPDIQGALVSLNPQSGAVEALAGGYSFAGSNYNRATQATRQTGSAFKPLVFLAALEKGSTAASLVNDAPIVFDDDELETAWRPQNVTGRFGGPTTLRQALYQSRNLVAIRLLRDIGIGYTLDYVGNLGIDTSNLPRDLSLSLGSGPMTPMELTRAYAIIANGGYAVEPYLIRRIDGPESDPLYEAPETVLCDRCQDDPGELIEAIMPLELPEQAKPQRVMQRVADERSVYIMHSILQDVITRGTGRRARAIGRNDLAGKTGTTNDQRDTWFAGFNHNLATGVWVGFDQPRSLGRGEFGGVTALPIWQSYTAAALEGTPSSLMPQPPGIITLRINPETGERVPSGTRNARFEVFRSDNAPEEPSEGDRQRESNDEDSVHPQELF